MEKPKRKPNTHQQIISRFVTVEVSATRNRNFWGNEMKIAGQLIKKYGADFLLRIPPPSGYKVASLVWFLTPEGKNYLSDQKFEYAVQSTHLVEKKEEISLSEAKIGDDVQIQRKPRTLKDFLNYGKKDTGQRQEGQ
jgi:hypothetical protein